MEKNIAQIVVGLPLDGPFDYAVPAKFRDAAQVGMRAAISFGHRLTVGFIVGFREKSRLPKIKPLQRLLDTAPCLDTAALRLAKEVSEYYGCSWGEAIEASLPPGLRKRSVLELTTAVGVPQKIVPESRWELLGDSDPAKRWAGLEEKIKAAAAAGQGVIVLVPEAAFLPKVQEILNRFSDVPAAVLDKKLSARQELDVWKAIQEGRIRVVVGMRSAIFAPVRDLGLIVVINEDHPAYKQEQSPFYHSREAAMMRAKIAGSLLLFVNPVPSAELWHALRCQGRVPEPSAPALAELSLIDMTNYKPGKRSLVSFPLQNHIQEVLNTGGKVVLFLNRRGFSTSTRCNQCGYTMNCPRCDARMTYLYSKKKMVCRLCQHSAALPKVCPQCKGSYMRSTGTGIEKLGSDLSRIFPQARITEYDRETAAVPREANIVIATQAVLKVLGEIRPELIAVLDMDAEFNRADFRSAQRALALLVALRETAKKKVVVQTFQRDNYALKSAVNLDLSKFYDEELRLREELSFPPFKHLVALVLRGAKETEVFDQANELFNSLKKRLAPDVEILDPQPDVQPKLRDKFRFIIMLKSESVSPLLGQVKQIATDRKRKRGVVVTVNVDP